MTVRQVVGKGCLRTTVHTDRVQAGFVSDGMASSPSMQLSYPQQQQQSKTRTQYPASSPNQNSDEHYQYQQYSMSSSNRQHHHYSYTHSAASSLPLKSFDNNNNLPVEVRANSISNPNRSALASSQLNQSPFFPALRNPISSRSSSNVFNFSGFSLKPSKVMQNDKVDVSSLASFAAPSYAQSSRSIGGFFSKISSLLITPSTPSLVLLSHRGNKHRLLVPVLHYLTVFRTIIVTILTIIH